MTEFKDQSVILSTVRRCVQNYGMIEDGDRIAVGVSGGKDSLTLLCALAVMRRFYPRKYSLTAITVDSGFGGTDLSPVTELCAGLGVPHKVVCTQISDIISAHGDFESPCSLCSRLRRGALHGEAEKIGCNKLALGHNRDDASVTLIMNLFYSGRIGVFSPKNEQDQHGVTLIRPLLYTSERAIREFCRKNALPVVKNTCPVDKKTHRETVKQILASVEKETPGAIYRIFRAIEKEEIDGFRDFD